MMIYNWILQLFTLWTVLNLLVLFYTFYRFSFAVLKNKIFKPLDLRIVLFGLIFSVIQLFILIVLYFISPKFNWWQFDFDKIFNEPIYFSYLIKYPFVNLIGVLSILIGWSIFKKARSDKKRFLRILIFYFIGFILILLSNLNRF